MNRNFAQHRLIAPALLFVLLFSASSMHAVNVCAYKVKGAAGFLCPVHAGATVCVPVNALTGNDCRNPLRCSGSLFCQVKLTPYSGPAPRCPFQSSRLRGFACEAPVRIPTRPPTPTVTPIPVTPTATVGVTCPLAAGRYTVTQTAGGTLRVATFSPFDFPAGGSLVEDVSAGDANCVHTTVVPFPGGYNVPAFCVPALGATTLVVQTGCGVGRIDSNGGSDFTITEHGDTSETTGCDVHQATCPATGPAPDSAGRLDVTVGDGLADICAPGAVGNAVATVPVLTTTWVAFNGSCPDSDGSFDANDTLLTRFPQTLDFTTDSNTARFADMDGDGCSKSGIGPTGPFTATGACINFTTGSVAVGAAGTIFTSAAPIFDLLFASQVPGTLSGPAAPGGSTCAAPPVIDFDGLATRCFTAF